MSPLLMLLLACDTEAPAQPTAATPTAATPTAAPALSPEEVARKAKADAAAAARASLPAAASRDRYGLTLGTSTHEQVEAWITSNKLPCQQFPSPTRNTYQYRCEGLLPPALLSDRTVRGAFTQVHLVRTEDAPVHFFSTMRKYAVATDAIADYDDTVAKLTALLGAPKRADTVPGPEKLSGPNIRIARYAAMWERSDLDVSLVLLKASGPNMTLQESWEVPGVEEQVETHARTGSVSGAEGKKPPGWNPHVSEAPKVGRTKPAAKVPKVVEEVKAGEGAPETQP